MLSPEEAVSYSENLVNILLYYRVVQMVVKSFRKYLKATIEIWTLFG
jgi:hypothetical protein